MLEIIQNFDWAETARKLVVFIPNYNRPEYVEFGIKHFATLAHSKDWMIIIGNDNCHYDFSHLDGIYNVKYFSLLTGNSKPRNCCRIRNYAIKRCRSSVFFQKDPEVWVFGDYVKNAMDYGRGWKAGYVIWASKKLSDAVLKDPGQICSTLDKRPQNSDKLDFIRFEDGSLHIHIDPRPWYDPSEIHRIVFEIRGGLNNSTYFAYALGIDTQILQNIGGYDEDYTSYGYEDTDMFCRLMKMGYRLTPDYSCTAIHLWHPLTVDENLDQMAQIFNKKDFNAVVRNPNGWGEGI